jgi:hypothetical protein
MDDSAGREALYHLFRTIVQSSKSLADEHLAAHVQAHVHPTVADVLVSWEE